MCKTFSWLVLFSLLFLNLIACINITLETYPTNQPPAASGASTIVTDIDGMTMVYVPAGEFLMGSEENDADAVEDEKPQHSVYLDAYYIDQTEVSNAQYKLCVQAGACDQPRDATYYNDSKYTNHPVVNVDWNSAFDYCEWAGRELPTEAQWEKAARGTDGRTYPWGNEFDSSLVNVDDETIIDDYSATCSPNGCDGYERTAPVGSFPGGASPYGAYDMVGNVWEWVADWYGENYYDDSPDSNPTGPNDGDYRVRRGGSWLNDEMYIRSAIRNHYVNPSNAYFLIGFRCARLP